MPRRECAAITHVCSLLLLLLILSAAHKNTPIKCGQHCTANRPPRQSARAPRATTRAARGRRSAEDRSRCRPPSSLRSQQHHPMSKASPCLQAAAAPTGSAEETTAREGLARFHAARTVERRRVFEEGDGLRLLLPRRVSRQRAVSRKPLQKAGLAAAAGTAPVAACGPLRRVEGASRARGGAWRMPASAAPPRATTTSAAARAAARNRPTQRCRGRPFLSIGCRRAWQERCLPGK